MATPVLAPAVAVVAPTSAVAQENDAYKQHMKNGVKLFQDRNYAAAIVEFEAAYNAQPSANPLINIALCHKALFNYPKAIQTLELALTKHEMTAGDKKAANDALAELRSLIGYVLIKVTPAEATVSIDGEDQPAAALAKPIAVGPGTHRISARLGGFATAEKSVTVVSGDKGQTVELKLSADKGYLRITGLRRDTVILVDQAEVGRGRWSGFVAPGTHVVGMRYPNLPPQQVQVTISAGKAQDVSAGPNGYPVVGGALAQWGSSPGEMHPPDVPTPPPKKPEGPPPRGFYALAVANVFAPVQNLNVANPSISGSSSGDGSEIDVGSDAFGAGGVRFGYRPVSVFAAEFLFQYGHLNSDQYFAPLSTTQSVRASYSMGMAHFGLNAKLMSSGRTVRFVTTMGGGLAYYDISFDAATCLDKAGENVCGGTGVEGFVQNEVGFELQFGHVLLGFMAQQMISSNGNLKAVKPESNGNTEDVFSSGQIYLGGGLRAGWAGW